MGERINRQTLDLPDELIGEILIRIPVKSLLRFKCVSKSWRSLISSKEFIREHLKNWSTTTDFTHHKVILGSKKINMSSCNACSLKSLLGESGKDLVFENLGHHPMRNSVCLNDFVSILGSCNGLVLMAFFTEWKNSVLWNPSTGEAKTIPCPPFARGRGYKWDHYNYGFGYDDATDDYKVVWISSIRRPFQTHIYSCRTNSWREIENFPKVLLLRDLGQFVNGRLHWLAEEGGRRSDIVSLSLVEEKYEVVPLPEKILYRHGSRLTLGNLGGYLSLAIDESIGTYVWVMKKYGEAESWTKTWIVKPEYTSNVYPLWLTKNGDFAVAFSVVSGSVVGVYDFENKVCRSRIDIVDSKIFRPIIYVESLVSPFGDEQLGQ